MLPNFLVIGAPRSGTTSLYEYLRAHPDVYMSTVKEPDFFTYPSLDRVNPIGTEVAVRDIHDDAQHDAALARDLAEYERLYAGHRDERCLGEASAVYLGDPTAAWHLRTYVPDAPFIVVLREPADRAYSHFHHAKRLYTEGGLTSPPGAEGRTVDEEFERAIEVASQEGMPAETVSEPEIWVRAGYYHRHLTRWFELFPREQFAIFLYEDLATDERGLMRRVYEHIGVDPSFELPTTEAFNATVVPRNAKLFSFFTTNNPVMRRAKELAPAQVRGLAVRTRNRVLGDRKPDFEPELRSRLLALYRDDTMDLQDLIGRDLSGWLDPAVG